MKLAIIGAGGHAKEVYSSYSKSDLKNRFDFSGFFINTDIFNELLYDYKIQQITELNPLNHILHIAIGDINTRQKFYLYFKELGFKFLSVIDPNSIIDSNTKLGESCFVGPSAIINIDCEIGICNIINSGVIVSHESIIGNFNNISPVVIICGNVKIANNNFIGAGSIIKEKVKIDNSIILGMGSIVLNNIFSPGTYIIKSNIINKIK
jgi:sugar O-acyltransferase (sialic acid O-acetyltransferase NeuD family)